MSLRIPDLYERFPLYDGKGFHVAYGVRKVQQIGLTVYPINSREQQGQFKHIAAHIDLQTQALAEQL